MLLFIHKFLGKVSKKFGIPHHLPIKIQRPGDWSKSGRARLNEMVSFLSDTDT